MLRNMRLDEDAASLRVETTSEKVESDLIHILLQTTGIGVLRSERVIVRDEEVALIVVLELNPVVERAHVVAKVETPVGRMPLKTRGREVVRVSLVFSVIAINCKGK